MSEWEIVPFEGLGPLRFAVPRSEIRHLLGDDFESFRKGKTSGLTDAYDGLGFHLYYDGKDTLEFIETFPPCDPVYHGIHCLSPNLDFVLEQLSNSGVICEEDVTGYDVPELGFALYAPSGTIEAVSIYRKGYYDRMRS